MSRVFKLRQILRTDNSFWKAQYIKKGALDRHVKSAHGGEVDPKCPACKEIIVKAEKAGVEL